MSKRTERRTVRAGVHEPHKRPRERPQLCLIGLGFTLSTQTRKKHIPPLSSHARRPLTTLTVLTTTPSYWLLSRLVLIIWRIQRFQIHEPFLGNMCQPPRGNPISDGGWGGEEEATIIPPNTLGDGGTSQLASSAFNWARGMGLAARTLG